MSGMSFIAGLLVGIVIGGLAVAAHQAATFLELWRKAVSDVGDRLENGQSISVEVSVGKYGGGDDPGGEGERSPVPADQEWRNN